MQVKMQSQEPKFKPKTLTIQIETEEEYQQLSDMLMYDVSIPELVCRGQKQKAEKLGALMGTIHRAF